MASNLPVFNVQVKIYAAGSTPPAGLLQTVNGQFYVGSRGILDIQPNNNNLWQPPIYIRLPKGTTITRNQLVTIVGSLWDVYKVRWVEAMHLGFPNEYVAAIVEQR